MVSILNLEPDGYAPEAKALLGTLGDVHAGPLSRDVLLEEVAGYEVLIVRLGHIIDKAVLEKASRLRVIVTATTGLNHIDLQAAAERNITVLSLKGERAFLDTIHATAEHTFGLLLALIRHIPFAHADVLAGRWDRNLFRGSELEGKVLGIVGLGRLGSKVAGYGKAFGMKVIAHDTDAAVSMEGVTMVALQDLALQSDIVTLHIPSSLENRHFINDAFLGSMKKGGFLINTARGDVLDQSALLAHLTNGHIAGAALDVLEEENDGSDPCLSSCVTYAKTHKNLILTPHTGGATIESMEKTEIFMARKLKEWLKKSSV